MSPHFESDPHNAPAARTAEAIERSERQLADFFENANIGLHWVGSDGRILRVNEAELALLGYTRDEYLGHHIAEFHVDPPVIADILARLGRGEALRDYPARMRAKDGSIRHVQINSSVLFEDDRFVHTRCLTVDVTERKREEDARALLASIVTASEDSIVSTTLDGIIQSWNSGAARLFGYTASEAIGQPMSLVIPQELLGFEQGLLERVRRGERVEPFETMRIAKDGRRVDVSVTVSPVRNLAGEVVGTSRIVRDITERKRTEEALRQADRRKNEFLATLGHELRNPLAPIRTAVGLLRTRPVDDPVVIRTREVIDRQVAQMARLLDDLLDVARLSSGKLTLQRSRVLLDTVLDAAIETSLPLIEQRRQRLSVRRAEQPIALDADAARLTQVFGNLLNNAAKYSPQDAQITVSVQLDDHDGTVVVAVRDTGAGIAPEMLDKVFELFTQAPEAPVHAPGGLGIGLSLARSLVELHGGSIGVASAGPGQGAEFTVRLPAIGAQRSRHDGDGTQSSVARSTPCSRVLVVDDNVDGAEMLAAMLTAVGCEVRTAHGGQAALEEAERFRPTVALLDIGMPDMDGLEVGRRLRATAWGKDLILVAVTGWGQEEDRLRSLQAGFDRHLVKPVDPDVVVELVRAAQARVG